MEDLKSITNRKKSNKKGKQRIHCLCGNIKKLLKTNEFWFFVLIIISIIFIVWTLIPLVFRLFLSSFVILIASRTLDKDIFKWIILFDVKYSGKKEYFDFLNPVRLIFTLLTIFLIGINARSFFNEKFLKTIINFFLIPFNLISFLIFAYLILRIFSPLMKPFWKFLKEDKIVHYVFLILIPIGIVLFGYQKFMGSTSVPLTINQLNGFYASLFTAIAVIGAIVGLAGWRTIKESKDQIEKLKKIETDTEFIRKKKQNIEWIEKKFQGLSNKNIASMNLNSPEDQERLTEIRDYVTKDIHDCSWLEVIYAYNLIYYYKETDKETRMQHLEQAETTLKYLENRILPNRDNLESQLLHIMGQLYTNKYFCLSKNYNFFLSKDNFNNDNKSDLLISKDIYNLSLRSLYIAATYFLKIIKDEKYHKNININEAKGNYALILIEFDKFEKTRCKYNEIQRILVDKGYDFIEVKNNLNIVGFLSEAEKTLKSIKQKSFNHYWDESRLKYYKEILNFETLTINEKIWRLEIEKNFRTRMLKHFKKDDEELFFCQIEKEQKEFGGFGFPGKQEFVNKLLIELKNRS